MTNTETPARYISNFEKVAALVEVESAGFYTGVVSDAMFAGIDEGFLTAYPETPSDVVAVRLTTAGRERLAGFRALLDV
jgi:hypothetical protein